ncbi:hypothetical protein ABH926_009849 [Catenulispora sp. GP43]|uniref:hypothetical protein n=1 Tax=Catenulispora sp. GP43 TaxID=3156263 RepID=UPI0035186C08
MSADPDHDGAVVEPDPNYTGGGEKQRDAVHEGGEGVVAPDPGGVTGGVKQSDPGAITGG